MIHSRLLLALLSTAVLTLGLAQGTSAAEAATSGWTWEGSWAVQTPGGAITYPVRAQGADIERVESEAVPTGRRSPTRFTANLSARGVGSLSYEGGWAGYVPEGQIPELAAGGFVVQNFRVELTGTEFRGEFISGLLNGTPTTGRCVGGPCLGNRAAADPAEPAWPALPSALVPLGSVSNGCGGGPAGVRARWGDTSSYLDRWSPFSRRYRVNFRADCNVHDAAYAGAQVRHPRTRGVIDFFRWNQRRADDLFLRDMRISCRVQIPVRATGARRDCQFRGGFTSFGARSRYNVVRRFGHRFYMTRPALGGTWRAQNGQVWQLRQSGRLVVGRTVGPPVREVRARIISLDRVSVVAGHSKTRTDTGVTLSAFRMVWNHRRPDRLSIRTEGGMVLTRAGSG